MLSYCVAELTVPRRCLYRTFSRTAQQHAVFNCDICDCLFTLTDLRAAARLTQSKNHSLVTFANVLKQIERNVLMNVFLICFVEIATIH